MYYVHICITYVRVYMFYLLFNTYETETAADNICDIGSEDDGDT